MAQLRIKQLAEGRGMNMSQLQRQSGLTMGVVRRYWYNTADGKAEGEPLEMVSLLHIHKVADVLGVHPRDLIASADEVFEGVGQE